MSFDAYESFAADLIARAKIPGAAVAIARDGKLVYERGFGRRDAAGSPVTPDTRFGLGSVTKSFPCLCVMQLAEAGKLSPDDPVTRHLPEFRLPPASADLTPRVAIHHFMTHSAGFPPEPALLHARAASVCADPDFPRMQPKPLGVPDDVCSFERVETYEELMSLIARQGWAALGAPGHVISYSNEGYVLLARIVERVSGQPFLAYLQRHVLDPLGLARTGLYRRDTAPLQPETIPFAQASGEVFPSPAWWDQGQMYGNGGLKSTVGDLLRYLELYRVDSPLLSRAGVARMTAPHQPIPTGGGYGYGFRIAEAPRGHKVVEHSGGNKGVATHVVLLPEVGLSAVALTNLANAPAKDLAYGLINVELGLAPDKPWADFPRAELHEGGRYEGTYEGRPGTFMRVSVDGSELVLDVAGTTLRARPYADDRFVVESTGSQVAFLTDERGRVWAAHMDLRTHRKVS
jgi:CubicO group peptidase (beta-lactamase class C family)